MQFVIIHFVCFAICFCLFYREGTVSSATTTINRRRACSSVRKTWGHQKGWKCCQNTEYKLVSNSPRRDTTGEYAGNIIALWGPM